MSGTGSTRYIPSNVVAFCSWLKKLIDYAMHHYERWRILPLTDDVLKRFADFERIVERCEEPTCSKIDIAVRNEMRKAIEKEARDFIQGMVIRNVNVTDEDRRMMGLPIRDTKPSPVGDPVGLVTAMVKYPQEGALELHIVHVEGTAYDKRANYGVKIVYDVLSADAALPADVSQLNKSKFTRRKKEMFLFDKKDSRKTAVFCLCYENSKGKSGQWGPIVSAVIP